MNKSSRSLWFWLIGACIVGIILYVWVIRPAMQRKAIDEAFDQGCERMIEKFNEEKDEMAEDLAAILEKMGDIEEENAELRVDIENMRNNLEAEEYE